MSSAVDQAHRLRVLDLFSCVGGHALGLHATGGFKTVAFVERDPFRRRVLAHHFPGVPLHDDVRTFTGERGSADIIVGGPPCQRTSIAAAIHGKRDGGTLWPDMLRIVEEVGPAWIVVEQPPGNQAWAAQVAAGLEGVGYHTARLHLSAWDFGAPHIRRRSFTLANASLPRLEVARSAVAREVERHAWRSADGVPWAAGVPGTLRVDAGVPGRLDRRTATLRRQRIEAIGDSNPPVMMTVIGLGILEAEATQQNMQFVEAATSVGYVQTPGSI